VKANLKRDAFVSNCGKTVLKYLKYAGYALNHKRHDGILKEKVWVWNFAYKIILKNKKSLLIRKHMKTLHDYEANNT